MKNLNPHSLALPLSNNPVATGRPLLLDGVFFMDTARKECYWCHRQFEAVDPKMKYCSDVCKTFSIKKRDKLRRQKNQQPIRIVICPICQTQFSTRTILKKYCSKKCAKIKSKEFFDSRKSLTTFKIFERDKFTCVYCGRSSMNDGVVLNVDHIYPINNGGLSDLYNLVTSCERCNKLKKDLLINEDIILLLWERNKLLNNKFTKKTYKELQDYFTKSLCYKPIYRPKNL